MTHKVILGLGSNDDPVKTLEKIEKILRKDFIVLKETELIQTKPIGLTNTPDFLNKAMYLETVCAFEAFRSHMKKLERQFNPENKKVKPLDLDILVWDGEIKKNDVYDRDFIRLAVIELLPELKGKLC